MSNFYFEQFSELIIYCNLRSAHFCFPLLNIYSFIFLDCECILNKLIV